MRCILKTYIFRCISCQREFSPTDIEYICPDCGERFGTLEVIYDYDEIKRIFTKRKLSQSPIFDIRRYLPLLPVENFEKLTPLKIGGTPLYEFPNIANELKIAKFYLKDDTRNPTASYKDRASAVVLLRAMELDKQVIATASTGNAACSLAGLGAITPLKVKIFIPKNIPLPKLTQIKVYGAEVEKIDGDYDKAYDICTEKCYKSNWYNRSAGLNPYLVEGKKTGAFEIAEQLDWNVPDEVFVPIGDGSIISGIIKGFWELHNLGFTDKIPQVIGVQAQGADIVKRMFEHFKENGEIKLFDREVRTKADSIAVGRPREGVKVVKYLAKYNGHIVAVSDEEIIDAIYELASKTGVFAEPAAAASFAGLKKYKEMHKLDKNDRVVVIITGSGLKAVTGIPTHWHKPAG